MVEKFGTTRDVAPAPEDQSGLAAFAEHAFGSFKYDLVQSPVTGVTQLADHVLGSQLESRSHMFKAPAKAQFGTAAWAGDLVGGVAAMGAQLAILHKFVGVGAASDLETSSSYRLAAALPAIGKSVATGLVVGGVLTPVNEQNGGDFWKQRLGNAGLTGLTFGGFTAGSISLKSLGNPLLSNDVLANSLPGIPLGSLNADAHSLLTNGHLASGQERLQSMADYSVGGAIAGGTNILHEYVAPTSGIKGVRTAEDMSRLADSTIDPEHSPRYTFRSQGPAKTDQLILDNQPLDNWYDRAAVAVRQEIDHSTMPLEMRKLVVSSNQEFSYGLDALSNRQNPKPLMTIYGSARFKPGDFRYERARYLGGRAAQEGYDVMTGGAPNGTMDAANRGAYEAGGNSIGVTIKVPHENADESNGYHTLTIPCRNFATRMQILKTVGTNGVIVVEEGGIGTGAEALDTLTHIQTNKMDKVPVYFVGSKTWGPLDDLLSVMQKRGTISPKDRQLYRIVDDPDEIFADLTRRR